MKRQKREFFLTNFEHANGCAEMNNSSNSMKINWKN